MSDDTITYDDKQADKDFDAGFSEMVGVSVETPPPAAPELKVEAAAPVPETPPVETPATQPEAPAIEYVQLTKEQFAKLEAAAKKTDDFDARISAIFGTVGNVKQIVEKLQSEAPLGSAITVPEDVVAEMAEEYPDIAKHFRKSLEKALVGRRGTGTAVAPEFDQEKINTMIRKGVIKHEMDTLQQEYPDWRDVVGTVDKDGKHDPNNAFRKWLATKGVEYQKKVNSTNSASVISNAIETYRADKAKAAAAPPKAPVDTLRKNRMRDAVQQRGDGSRHVPEKHAEDDFAVGFRQG